ncbi:7-cyano-7-deazaguanine synthase QueC [Anaeromyxobacter paludicola]|uniref:7-cyano-7-deazaguanine synthase n=1 Tax=Anaeromyxobacter paludicola TaxID=2918171 RepID=A0ABM7XEH5_9BACT|nr:7-cyano-7-deazaguanine synthase QueC [Anaeromyxobacter paludicola]BDG10269.1 7-cyano-7-deazaguanine synthase [Anaeromyxobacter paludicola]
MSRRKVREERKPRAVVLLSGGLDSTTCLAVAVRDGFEPHALSVDYGQRHKEELRRARRLAAALGAADHKVVKVDLSAFGGSALTDGKLRVPKGRREQEMAKEIPITYVPARNTVMLALALAHAETLGAQDVYVGVNAIDYSGYPDCRPEFIRAFEKLAGLATKAGVEGAKLRIHAPLQKLGKAEIVKLGTSLGVPYALTLSCYDPVRGKACGRCDACTLRRKGFEAAGVPDPTVYV